MNRKSLGAEIARLYLMNLARSIIQVLYADKGPAINWVRIGISTINFR